jgi:hypothetical protein
MYVETLENASRIWAMWSSVNIFSGLNKGTE